MQVVGWIQLMALLAILILLTRPLGRYIYQVLTPGASTRLDCVLKPVEKLIYRICRIDPLLEQGWKDYLACIMGFSFISLIFTFALLAAQRYLPLNPQHLAAPSWDLNLNISTSFMTNTNWQHYSGESTVSHFSQMAVLAVQNFLSGAVGLATAAALVRGIARKTGKTLGNFWADLVRISLYLFLPISIIAATVFIAEGVPQNLKPYVKAETLEADTQTIVQGPIASQQAIKLLGNNGGGFTNANSAHPYENPTPLSNFFQMLLMLLIPMAQIYYFGCCVGDMKHAWCIFAALAVLLVVGVVLSARAEVVGNPVFEQLGLAGGNWEGKEQRFGIFGSALYACITTASSCGAVNCMHDSLTPIGGFVPMLNMQLSETIFGGVGAGLYGVLLYVFLAIFIAGLVVGRTPEYLGKKIESFDIKMTMLATLSYVLLVHLFTAWSCFSDWGIEALGNAGAHGFSEIIYAYSSCSSNNGSAFAGLATDSLPYNLTLAMAMFFGRFLTIAPVMALAGSLVHKNIHPKSASSFPVSSLVFISLLVGVILLLGALTFLPALTMGPIIEQFYMLTGRLFS